MATKDQTGRKTKSQSKTDLAPKARRQCPHCDRSYSDSSHLSKHIKTVHKGFRYQCQHCDRVYSDSSHLFEHVKTVHKGFRYQCSYCDCSYSDRSDLRRHISIHQGVRYVCCLCGKQASKADNLRDHLRSLQHRLVNPDEIKLNIKKILIGAVTSKGLGRLAPSRTVRRRGALPQRNSRDASRNNLLAELLRNENPAAADCDGVSILSEYTQARPWTISELLRTSQTFFFEWRRHLLTRDWPSLANALTLCRKHAITPSNKRNFEYKTIFCENLWRILCEMMRFNFCNNTGRPKSLVDGIHAVMQVSPYFRNVDVELERLLVLGLWFAGMNQTAGDYYRSGIDFLTSSVEYKTFRRLRAASIDAMKATYKGLLLFHETAIENWESGDQYAKMLRLLRANFMSCRGVSGLLEHITLVLQKLDKGQDAAEIVEAYLNLYPDDLGVYESAINRLEPEYGSVFAMKLVEKADWHPLVVDFCQYESQRQNQAGIAVSVVCKLMRFLDYGKNKDNEDAWKLLLSVVSSIKDVNNRSVMEAWSERKSWWRKFHLKRTKSSNKKLDRLRKGVFQWFESNE